MESEPLLDSFGLPFVGWQTGNDASFPKFENTPMIPAHFTWAIYIYRYLTHLEGNCGYIFHAWSVWDMAVGN